VLSNFAILFPALWALSRKLVFESFVLLNVLVWSTLYHVCDEFSECALRFRTLYALDHFFAAYAFMVLAVYAMNLESPRLRILFNLMFAEATALILFIDGHVVSALVAFVTLVFVMVLCAWCVRGMPHYDWVDCVAAIVIGAAGVSLFFFTGSNKRWYWLTHSLWHGAVGAAAYFFLEIKNHRRRLVVIRNGNGVDMAAQQIFSSIHQQQPPPSACPPPSFHAMHVPQEFVPPATPLFDFGFRDTAPKNYENML